MHYLFLVLASRIPSHWHVLIAIAFLVASVFVAGVQVKKAMTLTEKILANHSDNKIVVPGQNIWTRVDKLMTHDVCGPGTFGIFQKEFGENARVWDPERVIIIPDHYIFTADERANRNVDILRYRPFVG
jgi:hypothetical protein